MNDVDWAAAVPVFALSLVVTVVLVALACVWAERRHERLRSPKYNQRGLNQNAGLK